MSKTELEIEVKFAVRDLAGLAGRLQRLGAVVAAERVHEINLRFDTPAGDLSRERRVLRLRQDAGAVMTYKGPQDAGTDVSARQEIEFQVSDFGAARRLLEALGYVVSVMYEKFRTTYSLDDLIIVLDEMPFGNFVEIEGPDSLSICAAAAKLGLDWEARSTASYLGLFNQLRLVRGLPAQNLAFAELEGVHPQIQELGLRYADGTGE
jgi:adenylate cyclase, class 2